MKEKLAIVILAAGQGTRMKSKIPKVLHPVMGTPMIRLCADTARTLHPSRLVLVVPREHRAIRDAAGPGVVCVVQSPPRGTGDALRQTRRVLKDFQGSLLVLYADAPLLTPGTLKRLIQAHLRSSCTATLLTAHVSDPHGYGRIVRNEDGNIRHIVEHLDATEEERAIREINSGVACFRTEQFWSALAGVTPQNVKKEYYLPDVIHLLIRQGEGVGSIQAEEEEIMGINDRVQLARASAVRQRRVLERLMRDGVTIEDPGSTFIEDGARIGQDTVIRPCTFIDAKTRIGRECVIGPFTVLKESILKDKVKAVASTVEQSRLENGCDVGPYAHLRAGTRIGSRVHVGNFAEIKNSMLGAGTLVGHFSYLGDARIGRGVNIGAGTVIANYDGKKKHRTVIGDKAFIGSNTTLVAPVSVGARAKTGAGSVVLRGTRIPEGAVMAGVPAKKLKRH